MTQDPDAAHWDGKPQNIRTRTPATNRHQEDVQYILEWCDRHSGFSWSDSVHWVIGYWVAEVDYTPNARFEGRGATPNDAVHHLAQTLRLIDAMEQSKESVVITMDEPTSGRYQSPDGGTYTWPGTTRPAPDALRNLVEEEDES